MKQVFRLMVAAAGLAVVCGSVAALGQAPAGAPAGSTGQCKDGTYSTAASKQGACRGHQGVKDWYVPGAAAAGTKPATMPAAASKPATMPAPAAASKPAAMPAPTPAATRPAAMPAPAPAAAPAKSTPMAPAAGGGAGMVWVNTDTKVYHCSGSQFYGKTKQGKYMSEADAKAMGARADHNKPCMK